MTPPSPGAARAVADLSTGKILATVDVASTRSRVLTTCEITQRWGSAETHRIDGWPRVSAGTRNVNPARKRGDE